MPIVSACRSLVTDRSHNRLGLRALIDHAVCFFDRDYTLALLNIIVKYIV